MGNNSSKKNPPIIAQCSSPAYCIKSVGSRHLILAGGGGAAKTGVANNIQTLLLSYGRFGRSSPAPPPSTSQTVALKTYLTSTIKTDPHATMNMDVVVIGAPEFGKYILAAGHDQYCDIYESKGYSLTETETDHEEGKLTLNFEHISRIISDEKANGPYQKTVRFDRTIIGEPRKLITGGADGSLRIWDVEDLRKKNDATIKPVLTICAHNGDIDDLDICSDGNTVISVGYDAHVYLWNINDGKKLIELPQLPDIGKDFRVRSVRFTTLGSSNIIFVAAYNQVRRTPKSISYLTLWAFNRERNICKPILVREACKETISTLSVSGCGNFTAIGTLGGSVGVYDTHEMKVLYFSRETHGIFVTGVEFLPSRAYDIGTLKYDINGRQQHTVYPGVSSEYKTAIVSLSADQTVQFHAVPFTNSPSFTLFLIKLSIFTASLYYIVWYFCGYTR